MNVVRSQAANLARQSQRQIRRYASDSHSHHHAAPVNESFGTGAILTVGTVIGGMLVFQFMPSKPEDSVISRTIAKYSSKNEDWAEINALHTKAQEQAAYDRNLFENASSKARHVELFYPEAIHSHSARNISAGQIIPLDHVVEHYKQQAAKEDERRIAKLAEKNN